MNKIFSKFKKRMLVTKIEKQLLDMLSFLENGLKAGLSLHQTIEMASVELTSPIRDELKEVVAQVRLGRSLDDALVMFSQKIPSKDLSLFVHSVVLLRRSGGNMIEAFAMLVETMDGRRRVSDRIRILTAQGLFQGIALLVMPWILAAAIALVSPDYLVPLISTRMGNLFIAVGILLEFAGAVWLRKIVMIKV